MTEDPRPALQRDVQRLLGRCMLRIQQYERLMKAMLAHHELAGPVETLEVQRSTRIEKLSDKSLGTLVKALFETYVVPDGFERDLLPDDKVATDRISMAFSFRMSMAPDRWAQTKEAVEDLVAMRNDLVHHLIDRFDVWSEEGCVAAVRNLEDSYGRIDRHYLELVEWATNMEKAREMAASFSQSQAFHDLVVSGIAPDGSFEWSSTGIVRVLRESLESLAPGDWARLDVVRHYLGTHHPEQVPEKYGCRSWQQVLNDSRAFELQYRPSEDGSKVAWVRARVS
jgi:OST-HTH/LOTUS domain